MKYLLIVLFLIVNANSYYDTVSFHVEYNNYLDVDRHFTLYPMGDSTSYLYSECLRIEDTTDEVSFDMKILIHPKNNYFLSNIVRDVEVLEYQGSLMWSDIRHTENTGYETRFPILETNVINVGDDVGPSYAFQDWDDIKDSLAGKNFMQIMIYPPYIPANGSNSLAMYMAFYGEPGNSYWGDEITVGKEFRLDQFIYRMDGWWNILIRASGVATITSVGLSDGSPCAPECMDSIRVVDSIRVADSLYQVFLEDSIRVADSLYQVFLEDSIRVVDSLRQVFLEDSIHVADSLYQVFLQDSIYVVDSIYQVFKLDSIKSYEDSVRIADSLATPILTPSQDIDLTNRSRYDILGRRINNLYRRIISLYD